ncbi:MAG TPA: CDP-alcohol phosphatidyltransferase family protein [Chloroflexi bacterium]|nr:CDP-alcohol phosphatidyltransferase family protein [Chloroflexota bacterium]
MDVHPNTLSLLGSLLSVGVAAVLTTGRLTLAGWLLVIVAPIDAFDGALARVTGQKSRFGAFLDSTLDRVSEAALLAGLATHYLRYGATTEVILAFVALVGSMMVSYTRARAEAAGFSCKIGVLTRLERTAVLAIGLILGWPTVALWVLAVGSSLTALQRVLHVYQQSRRAE